MTQEQTTPTYKRIKSFVLRQGRMSKGQNAALEKLWKTYGLEPQDKLLNLEEVFGRSTPTYLEIGFGMGTALAQMAEENPENNYLGIEVHRPGVGALCKLIEEKNLTNIRIFNHDAVEILEKMLPLNSLAGAFVFFPDPWHKERHKKRRLIQPNFVKMLADKIQPQGFLHLATDWEDYAEQMLEVLSDADYLTNTSGAGNFTPRPDYRPLTKFEQRGLNLGHGVWDLIFYKGND